MRAFQFHVYGNLLLNVVLMCLGTQYYTHKTKRVDGQTIFCTPLDACGLWHFVQTTTPSPGISANYALSMPL